jgi:cytochrome c-type biogenesis protein
MLSGARTYINIVSGIIVLLFGLQLLFNFLPFMNYEKRAIEMKKPLNLAGSFVFGLAFGAGWTPCIGPVLSGILFMAAGEGNVARAVLYLALYSLGLALPFFLFALLGARLSGLHTRLKKILPVFNIISGLLIIAVGVLILLGQLTMLNSFFQRFGWSFVL